MKMAGRYRLASILLTLSAYVILNTAFYPNLWGRPTSEETTITFASPVHPIGRLTSCLNDTCIDALSSKIARVFTDKTDHHWCIHTQGEASREKGIVLVKSPKSASSTAAGLALRLAQRLNCSAVQTSHRKSKWYAQNLQKNETFLFSTIREPASRAISRIFYTDVSIRRREPTDDRIIHLLKTYDDKQYGTMSLQGGFQLNYLNLERNRSPYQAYDPAQPTVVQNVETVIETVKQVLDTYDFIISTERISESMAALAVLLGVDVGEVLVLPAKVSAGGMYWYQPSNGRCVPLAKSFVSENVKAFLSSDEWRALNYGDLLLHRAVHNSLDKTIQHLGDRFTVAHERYLKLMKAAEERCTVVHYPCSSEGKPQLELSKEDCYAKDEGCGYKCIDKMLSETTLE